MNFSLENFAPIESAKIKVNDLTLIFGDNNTGKTYIAYALYGLLKTFDIIGVNIISDDNFKKFMNKGEISINKESLLIKDIVKNITSGYAKIMASEVFVNSNEIIPKIKLSDVKLSNKVVQYDMIFGESKIIINSNKNTLDINLLNKTNIPSIIVHHELNKILIKILFDIPNVFISVAERLGISLFQKDLDLNTSTLLDHIKKNKEIDPFALINDYSSRYAMPVKHNIDFMRAIEDVQKDKSALNINLSEHIENMIGGKLKHVGDGVRFFNNRRGNNKMDIPLHLASASVRALSNLYFFLKHKAKTGDLIIIDEPESHLSLAKQRLLAKLIADCINNDLKILLTTHSDTLVLELNNLIMLSSDFADKEKFIKEHKYNENQKIDYKKVSAYIAQNNSVVECKIDKYGIEVDSMDNEIDKLNEVRDGLSARIYNV
jgi:energy-coupling factor transporter ATP-binding protein EcfA2